MKTQTASLFIILLSIFILYGCSKPIEKKLAGTWKVEDMQFKTDIPLDEEMLEASKESQRSISIELMEDMTAKINTGFSVFEGTWIFKEAENAVYMIFSGTSDTILLGTYENEKLINVEENPDIMITTIFKKEKK